MNIEKRLYSKLKEITIKNKKQFLSFKEILVLTPKSIGTKPVSVALNNLKSMGLLYEDDGRYCLAENLGLVLCKITKVTERFGFAGILDEENNLTQKEIFIPGRNLFGAMQGDIVLVKVLFEPDEKNPSQTGKVVQICKFDDEEFSGTIVKEGGNFYIIPDNIGGYPLFVQRKDNLGCKSGDKAMGKIVYRGRNHSSHNVVLTKVFGNSECAKNCCEALVEAGGITNIFPDSCIDEAKRIGNYKISKKDFENRLDLRDEIIFTIDSADTKDIDDAISISKTKDGWNLGVHIADVSYFVTPKSPLDEEAFSRGCSIYYANKVIPMLPKELSNGICSLNPKEDRLAFSCFMSLDKNGDLIKYTFKKSIINSAVKGVYSEINKILDGCAEDEIIKKYACVGDGLEFLKELFNVLEKRRKKRGALDLESTESKLILNEDDICVDIIPRTRGISEQAIEEFMLLANEAAALTAKNYPSPFIYRVHEQPPENKLESLYELLKNLGFTLSDGKKSSSENLKNPLLLCKILEKARERDLGLIVNTNILRSMAKAKYSNEPIGHFGLVLEDYAHFTSPIRRYPDLCIHRILNDICNNMSEDELNKKYSSFVVKASAKSTEREIEAMKLERNCDDFYKAEYMKNHLGSKFSGIISSVTSFGIYIELENTCEGLIRIADLPEGVYDYNDLRLKNMTSGTEYRIGDKIDVMVTAVDINAGNVDFNLAN